MSKYIDAINIHAFRGLKDVCIQQFGDINVFLGDNNAGKTSILELLCCTQAPESLAPMGLFQRIDSMGRNYLYEGIKGVFPADDEGMQISYSFRRGIEETEVRISGRIEDVKVSERERQRINGFIPTGNTKDKALDATRDAKCLEIEINVKGESHYKFFYTIYDFQYRLPKEQDIVYSFPALMVSPMEHLFIGYQRLNRILENIELQKKMTEVLKLYDESIEGIQAIENEGNVDYRILSNKHKVAIPLTLYGDGMKKAVELVSAVVSARGGILLIDEFETSIHISAMRDTFKWILSIAKENNVQIFMTTHSQEAVRVLLDGVVPQNLNLLIHTLYNKDERFLVRTLDYNEAKEAIDQFGMDLRG